MKSIFLYKKILSMKIKEQGLYLPEFEHENCGAGFICNLKGEKTNQIIHDALELLVKNNMFFCICIFLLIYKY